MSKRTLLGIASAVGAAAVIAVVAIAVGLLRGPSGLTTSDPEPIDSPEQVAGRMVELMNTYDADDAGPNAWLERARPDLTEDAYAFYRQTLGPGDGPTNTPFWTELVGSDGYQRVTTSNIHEDPAAEATNTDVHVTLMVPFEVDFAGIDSPLANGDRLFFVNLDRPDTSSPWKVSYVVPTTGLLEDYATESLQPLEDD